jgi:protein-tyrosine kinase
MSIIEKAVNTLEKRALSGESEDRMDGGRGEADAVDTVQKAASGIAASEQSSTQAAARHIPVAAEPFHEQVGEQTTVTAASVRTGGPAKKINLSFDEMQAMGMLTPAIPRSAIAEEYRTIKRPLLTNIAGQSAAPIKNANLIMVTSALQGDGKTFSSINLALSIAMEQDKTVLFVDADTAKAEAGRLLGVPSDSPGLIDVLENKGLGLSDVILHTNVEKLRVLPAGNIHAHANELLASDAMRRLMLELSERYSDRVIVFDSPPLLLTTEAAVLSNFMGQIVFVVAADATPQRAVSEAMEHIGQDKVVGMVLNRARRHGKLFGYGYGYGYGRDGYGYGYGYGNRVRDSAPEA